MPPFKTLTPLDEPYKVDKLQEIGNLKKLQHGAEVQQRKYINIKISKLWFSPPMNGRTANPRNS